MNPNKEGSTNASFDGAIMRTEVPTSTKNHKARKKVWIDIDNSPHVPFFLPIIEELKKHDVELFLTARDMYQVCELLEFFHLPCTVVGGHYGKSRFFKVAGTLLRTLQLIPVVGANRPDLAVSHCSRAQILLSKLIGIETLMINDYEHSTKTPFFEPDWLLMPEVISCSSGAERSKLLKYPGLKEDVYVPRFMPDPSILAHLGISDNELVVTMRPPATEAHYHNPESATLFISTLRFLAARPGVRIVTLPRNARQSEELKRDWKDLIASGRMIIPSSPVNGLNLIWFSDLVVSGGGTMNREAAALGVPVYSIFRGKMGAVDQALAKAGRLVLIGDAGEIESRIVLKRWQRPPKPDVRSRPAMETVVGHILSILDGKQYVGSPITAPGHAGGCA